ncbi:MAG: YbjN domain-containing protein [Acidobacteriota bacterium]
MSAATPEKKLTTDHWPLITALIVILLFAHSIRAQSQQDSTKQDTAKTDEIPALLQKLGYSFTKVADKVYEVPFTGKNIKNFTVRVTYGGDVLLIICKLADRREVNTRGGLALKLIELNNDYDFVKFALSKDALYTRIDIHKRLVDADELKFLIDAMAHVVDESLLSLKRFFVVAAKPRRG